MSEKLENGLVWSREFPRFCHFRNPKMKSVLLAVAFVALMASTAGAVKLVDANTGNWTVGKEKPFK